MVGVNNTDSDQGRVEDINKGVNNKGNNSKRLKGGNTNNNNKSVNKGKGEGVNNNTNEQQGVNNNTNKQQGVNNNTYKQNPVSNLSNDNPFITNGLKDKLNVLNIDNFKEFIYFYTLLIRVPLPFIFIPECSIKEVQDCLSVFECNSIGMCDKGVIICEPYVMNSLGFGFMVDSVIYMEGVVSVLFGGVSVLFGGVSVLFICRGVIYIGSIIKVHKGVLIINLVNKRGGQAIVIFKRC
ncbi:hypothetical protein CWI38_0057p0120 [Hamiltosporidium tvaerminnensis]|uniref:Uncharacterized protein n=1 Tax=Hamiltosporidium tvaerminnensis TaxID=1176355 RepID=A0A4Q9M467_9MICR|nr:hypothetical protein CWI38_0057p0120 [Hamiltosporidium tvaerminnensis]